MSTVHIVSALLLKCQFSTCKHLARSGSSKDQFLISSSQAPKRKEKIHFASETFKKEKLALAVQRCPPANYKSKS